jgi:uncharacterized protein
VTQDLTSLLTPERRVSLRALATKHGVKNVRVFGSYARGEARLSSDLDLLVDLDYGRGVAMRLVEFVLEAEALLGLRVDVVSARGLDARLHAGIFREARAL